MLIICINCSLMLLLFEQQKYTNFKINMQMTHENRNSRIFCDSFEWSTNKSNDELLMNESLEDRILPSCLLRNSSSGSRIASQFGKPLCLRRRIQGLEFVANSHIIFAINNSKINCGRRSCCCCRLILANLWPRGHRLRNLAPVNGNSRNFLFCAK